MDFHRKSTKIILAIFPSTFANTARIYAQLSAMKNLHVGKSEHLFRDFSTSIRPPTTRCTLSLSKIKWWDRMMFLFKLLFNVSTSYFASDLLKVVEWNINTQVKVIQLLSDVTIKKGSHFLSPQKIIESDVTNMCTIINVSLIQNNYLLFRHWTRIR